MAKKTILEIGATVTAKNLLPKGEGKLITLMEYSGQKYGLIEFDPKVRAGGSSSLKNTQYRILAGAYPSDADLKNCSWAELSDIVVVKDPEPTNETILKDILKKLS
jgi:hypothetical protein